MNKINLLGHRFGRLIVIKEIFGRKKVSWLCVCDCGNTKITTGNLLQRGESKSCGCLQKEKIASLRSYDLIGKKFGLLTVIKKLGRIKNNAYIYWECKCDCGTITQIITGSLMNGNSKSCGCINLSRLKSWTGSNHPNWNFNLSQNEREYNKKYRKSTDPKFKEWSLEVKKQANFICQRCFKSNIKLESHHIKSWLNYPNERYKIENGICLCKQCHKQFHQTFGYKNCDDKIWEFINEYQ